MNPQLVLTTYNIPNPDSVDRYYADLAERRDCRRALLAHIVRSVLPRRGSVGEPTPIPAS